MPVEIIIFAIDARELDARIISQRVSDKQERVRRYLTITTVRCVVIDQHVLKQVYRNFRRFPTRPSAREETFVSTLTCDKSNTVDENESLVNSNTVVSCEITLFDLLYRCG